MIIYKYYKLNLNKLLESIFIVVSAPLVLLHMAQYNAWIFSQACSGQKVTKHAFKKIWQKIS